MRPSRPSKRQRRRVSFEAFEIRDLLAYDVSLVDDVVTFLGDGDADSLALGVDEGGFLQHDLPLTSNLVSPVDLDSAMAGEQRVRLDSLSLLDVRGNESTAAVVVEDTAFSLGEADLRVRASEIVILGQSSTDDSAAVTLVAGRNIRLTETASIRTDGGDISLTANTGAVRREGDFHGVSMIGATISSARGDITLKGRGGDAPERFDQDGVHIEGDSVIKSREAGRISLDGEAGAGVTGNDGVQIFGAGTRISAIDGSIEIKGLGSPDSTGQSNRGVTLREGTRVVSTGTGPHAATIRIHGAGGAGNQFNHGVHIRDLGTGITTVDGGIEIIGDGGRSEQFTIGVVIVDGGSITSTGVGPSSGTIRVRGTGGSGTSFNDGVLVADVGTKIASADGALAIEGLGSLNVTGEGNTGVEIRTGAIVESTGGGASAATISITGRGGNGTRENAGVSVDDLGTSISSVDGDITLVGFGNGSDGWNHGTRIYEGARVVSTGVGPSAARITIMGTSSSGDGDNRGVWMDDAATAIRSVDGDILIHGTGGNQMLSQGVFVARATIESTGVGPQAASIVIDGTGGDAGVLLSRARVVSRDGDVDILGNGISLTTLATATRQKQTRAEDVNGDGEVSPIDSLVIINALIRGSQAVESEYSSSMFYDTNGDGVLSPADALLVINYLNRMVAGEGHSSADDTFRAGSALATETGAVDAIEWPTPDSFGHSAAARSELESSLIDRVFQEVAGTPDLRLDVLPQ